MQKQTKAKTKITEVQTIRVDTLTTKTMDTTTVSITKTTDITIIATHQTSNKTETTKTNNHVDIATEQIIGPVIVKPVLIAEDWDICLANLEHHDKVRTIGNKYRKLNKTGEITITQLLSSVVDDRSLYVQTSILNKQVEAVCDSGASVSCLGGKLFNQISEKHYVNIQPSRTGFSTANQMPVQFKGTVSVPIKIGPKTYEKTFHVLKEAASDCLLGLYFLETSNCDALLSESKL